MTIQNRENAFTAQLGVALYDWKIIINSYDGKITKGVMLKFASKGIIFNNSHVPISEKNSSFFP